MLPAGSQVEFYAFHASNQFCFKCHDLAKYIAAERYSFRFRIIWIVMQMQDEFWAWGSGSRMFRLATHCVEIFSRQPDENWERMGMKIIVIRMAVFAFACVCNRMPVNYQLYIYWHTVSHLSGRWWICMGRRETAMVRDAIYTDSFYELKQINSYEVLTQRLSVWTPYAQLMNRITYSAEHCTSIRYDDRWCSTHIDIIHTQCVRFFSLSIN